MSKLGEITLNGQPVSIFKPPHDDGPDFPWVDVEQLASAWLSRDEAKRLTLMTHKFAEGSRPYSVVRNGDRVATVVCHAMAQGLTGMIDHKMGWRSSEEQGPICSAYSKAFAVFAADNYPMSFEEIAHAYRNPGGSAMR